MSLSDGDDPKPAEIWHPYWVLEETASNMWGSVKDRQSWIGKAADFTGDAELYGSWMLRVIEEWPRSCEHNLTKPGDKRPWIGHAAVALAIGCPEEIVRQAWSLLSEDQQTRANAKAQSAIDLWKSRNAKKTA